MQYYTRRFSQTVMLLADGSEREKHRAHSQSEPKLLFGKQNATDSILLRSVTLSLRNRDCKIERKSLTSVLAIYFLKTHLAKYVLHVYLI